jgi:hypothetical protein
MLPTALNAIRQYITFKGQTSKTTAVLIWYSGKQNDWIPHSADQRWVQEWLYIQSYGLGPPVHHLSQTWSTSQALPVVLSYTQPLS